MSRAPLAPLLLLLAYGAAFAAAALGTSLPAFDDHPGQLYRLHHLVNRGPAPWAWNPDWWAGYPELQFYPPGYFYLGALIAWGSLGSVSVDTVYRVLAWLTYLAPGASTFLALVHLTGSGWLALPGAFVALTLSAGVTSGVEGGVHVGMLPARLGWAVLPLLLLSVRGWLQDAPPARRHAGPWLAAAPLLAALVLLHPAHAPAGIALVLVAGGLGVGPRGPRLVGVATALLLATALTAFWTVPLLARLQHVRPLAWGSLAPLDTLAHPVLVIFLALAVAAWPLARTPADRLVAAWPWAVGAIVVLDALALEPRGVRWLPADRVADGGWLAVVLAGGAAGATLLRRVAGRLRVPPVGLGLTAVAALIALSVPGRTLSLWPATPDWPSAAIVERDFRLGDLWVALGAAPPGRALYVRSGVPLVHGPQWWRPHTHAPALTPLHAGRGIVNGTFTHPSPVAALVYSGSAGPGPIMQLVEQLDGRTLFGRPLEQLDPATFNGWAERLGVAVVVALEEDLPRLHALEANAVFGRPTRVGPFRLYARPAEVALPSAAGRERWRVELPGPEGAWVSARITDYPLWRAERNGVRLQTRRGPAWDLEVKLDGGAGPVELIYEPGTVETAATLTSGLAVTALAIAAAVAAVRRLSR